MTFFSKQGELAASGVFSAAHCVYVLLTISAVIIALCLTRKADNNKQSATIRLAAILLCFIEALKIIFVLASEPKPNPNSFLPFYFCSIEMYASLFAAFGKSKLKKTGEVFMMTGGIIGGLFFIIYPLTSLSIYPAFHFISLQSFLYHGIMLFAGLFMLIVAKKSIKLKDIIYHCAIVLSVSAIALLFNILLDTNLMFISQNYPGTFIEPIYNALPTPIFTVLSATAQATVPFLAVYAIVEAVHRTNKRLTHK